MPDERAAEKVDGAIRRKFVFAPDMKKLGERVEAAEKAAEQARELYEDLDEKADDLERLCHLAAAVRDFARGLLTSDELQSECDKVVDGLEFYDQLPEAAKQAIRRVGG